MCQKNHLFAEMLRKIREGLHWPLHASFFFYAAASFCCKSPGSSGFLFRLLRAPREAEWILMIQSANKT